MTEKQLWTIEKLNSQFGLRKKYREFNKRYFDGVLQGCIFKTELWEDGKKPDRHIAQIKCRHRWHGGWIATMYFMADVEWTEEGFDEVLIHEMVHYWLHIMGKENNWFPHDRRFRRKCRELNRRYGLNLTIYECNLHHMNEIPPKNAWERFLQRIGLMKVKTTGPYPTYKMVYGEEK